MSYQGLLPGQGFTDENIIRRYAGKGVRVAVIGTSLVSQAYASTPDLNIKNINRGWLNWAEVLSHGRIYSPVYTDNNVYVGWEPSGVPSTTRNYNGLNFGVSGQFFADIEARLSDIIPAIDTFDIIFVDVGTNDISPQTKEDIQAARERVCEFFLGYGKTVILLPILAREITSWTSGSSNRKKANWINNKSRDYVRGIQNMYLFDWNKVWVDMTNGDGEPFANYSYDGIHISTAGAFAIGKAVAEFIELLIPEPQVRVFSPDDLYDVTDNPLGNFQTNPFLSGIAGTTVFGATGVVADGYKVENADAGTSTVVCSKENRLSDAPDDFQSISVDNRGEYQVLTFTPNGVANELFYFRTNTADIAHTYATDTWVQASCEIDCDPKGDGLAGVTLYLQDNGTNGIRSYCLQEFDNGGTDEDLPDKNWTGLLVTPPIKVVAGSTTLKWRVEIRLKGTASGSPVVKIGSVETRAIDSPEITLGAVIE